MPTEMFNHCLLCNPEVNWLEVEFRSERNEPITGLTVTITNPSSGQTLKKSAPQGRVRFENIVAAEWVVNVNTDTLLSKVEQYASRKDNEDSPVQTWTKEQKDCCGNPKAYYHVTVGDLWESPPKDSFLVENHGPSQRNYRDESKGFRTSHNRSSVLEIKALRSYMPMIVDTDEFNLVNSYTFALLSKLAYANDRKSLDDNKSTDTQGSLNSVISKFKKKEIPVQSSNLKVQWIVKEIPYSHSLSYSYYSDSEIGAEGYIIFNNDISIIGVRGSEPYLNDRNQKKKEGKLWEIVKHNSGLRVTVSTKLNELAKSPAMQDFVKTNIDAAQIAPPEFGGEAYVHRGFYEYAMALWNILKLNSQLFENKKLYICGHSLGGAGALILSTLVNDKINFKALSLYTYGMPRAGTQSFVSRYQGILHYRHVNNHDLVPQVPTTWMNTDFNEGFESSDVFISRIALAKKMLTDDDDDNYMHHGHLSQLITYDSSLQVLLTPRQTQIRMLDIAKMAKNDSVALTDSFSDASIADHSMDEYILKLGCQLRALSKESLYENYQGAINYLEKQIVDTRKRQEKAEQANIEAWGAKYSPLIRAKRDLIKMELFVIDKQLKNYHQVYSELSNIMNSPERLPLSLILLANQSLPDDIKDQIQ